MLAMPLCAAAETKSEVVYANLKSTGSVRRVAVVNKFDLGEAGQITDYGTYESLTNLTNLTPLADSGDTVTAKAEAGSFYYEGVLAASELPWDIFVTCTLDGQPVSPEALGGKSGHLEMAIDVRKNEKANPVYFENYTLQMQVVLDGSKCQNVRAPESTVADQGSDILVGSSGNDILMDLGGEDLLTGGAGADKFVLTDMLAPDTITDYNHGEGDSIDLSALLDQALIQGGGQGTLADFVKLTNQGPDRVLQIDANGTAGGASFTTVAIFTPTQPAVVHILYDNAQADVNQS
jgi:hypothetical protein